ncbi:MAG: polysaccharide deacetylase family protein [Vicinamibacterales bacterium]
MTRLPILTFHALDHEPAVYSLAPQIFRHGIRQLHAHGYTTIDLADVVARLRGGRTFPPRTVAITFDDGYWSFYAEAFPVLQEYGMSATVFIATGDPRHAASHERVPTLEGREMLGWSQIREMARAGIRFGAHSMTHPDLRTLSDQDVSREILGSRDALEDRLGEAVSSFAYPFGRFDQRSRAIVQEHFMAGVSDALGFVGPSSDSWTLERLDTYYLRSERRFNTFFEPWFPSYIRARNVPRRLKRWMQRV